MSLDQGYQIGQVYVMFMLSETAWKALFPSDVGILPMSSGSHPSVRPIPTMVSIRSAVWLTMESKSAALYQLVTSTEVFIYGCILVGLLQFIG